MTLAGRARYSQDVKARARAVAEVLRGKFPAPRALWWANSGDRGLWQFVIDSRCEPAAGWSDTAGSPAISARISWSRHISSSAPCEASSSWCGCRSRKPGRLTTRSLTRGLCFIVHEPSG